MYVCGTQVLHGIILHSAIHKLTAPTGTGMYVCMYIMYPPTYKKSVPALSTYVCMYIWYHKPQVSAWRCR